MGELGIFMKMGCSIILNIVLKAKKEETVNNH